MTNLDSIFKSRDITLPTKVYLVKAMVFPVVMYGCESWAIKKESWVLNNWCFWTVVLEKTLESHLDCKEIQPVHLKGDPSWIFFGRTGVESETLILWPSNVNWKTLMLGKIETGGEGDDRGLDSWMASLTQWTSLSKFRELLMDWEAWRATVHGVAKSQTRLSDWNELNWVWY